MRTTSNWKLNRSTPGFLVMGEIWYPQGWKVTLNGEDVDMIRTNYVLRGFEIPAGNHTLKMEMEPVWYTAGQRISQLGTFLLFGLGFIGLFVYYRKPQKSSEPDSE